MSDDEKDQDIGYKKPPKAHQFKPGQSGNPRGRPKKPNTLTEALKCELEEEIPVTEHGKIRRITRIQALVKTLMHKALQGDAAMMRMLLNLLKEMKSPDPTFEALPEDENVLKDLLDQMESLNCEQDDSADP